MILSDFEKKVYGFFQIFIDFTLHSTATKYTLVKIHSGKNVASFVLLLCLGCLERLITVLSTKSSYKRLINIDYEIENNVLCMTCC